MLSEDLILRGMIKQSEGWRAQPYNDRTGKDIILLPPAKVTIFWGLNLTDLDQETAIQLGELALTIKLNQAEQAAKTIFPQFSTFTTNRQRAILSCIYNLGAGGFAHFTKTIKYINSNNWDEASSELKNSSWFNNAVSDNISGLVKRINELSSLLKRG
jgi:GH24 family phage-related lysozyme (muramidase)